MIERRLRWSRKRGYYPWMLATKHVQMFMSLRTTTTKDSFQLTKTLRLLKGLQTQMVELQRQHGPAKGPSPPDAPREAGSSS
ncbi:hypothetical protein Tco_1467271 [Tanacetum coccineum]